MLVRAKMVAVAQESMIDGISALDEDDDEDDAAQERRHQQQAERVTRFSLEEDLALQQEALAAEAARRETEKMKQAMICFGTNDPFSSDAGRPVAQPLLLPDPTGVCYF